jgi:nucleoid-associated protein YgaU
MVGVLLFSYFRSVNKPVGQTSSSKTEIGQEESESTYTVQAGDSLWSIAEAKYGSGYKWTEIYEANKGIIANANVIEIGTKIKLLEPDKANTTNRTDGTYTVAAGDNLWKIAQEKCGDGFAWTKISSDNQLANPQVIHAGNVLRIVCTPTPALPL